MGGTSIDDYFKVSRRVYFSSDPGEPFIIFDLRNGGYVFLDLLDETEEPVLIDPPRVAKAEEFLQERIGRYVYGKAILTIACGSGDNDMYIHRWDARARKNRIYYGYSLIHYIYLIIRIYWCLERYGELAMILRSFLKRYSKKYKVPYKEVRGYILYSRDHGFAINPVDISELYKALNTDPLTGKSLEPEPTVIYCIEDKCIKP